MAGHFFRQIETIHAGPTLRFRDQRLRIVCRFAVRDHAAHHPARAQVTHQGARFDLGDADHILRAQILVQRGAGPPVADHRTQRADGKTRHPDTRRLGIVRVDADVTDVRHRIDDDLAIIRGIG